MAGRNRSRRRSRALTPVLPARVPQVLRAIARWAVATSMGLAPACAAHSEPEAVWQPIGCGADGLFPNLLERVQLNETFDYLGIYGQYHTDAPTAADPGSYVRMEIGTACAGAAHPGDCNTELARQQMTSRSCDAGRDCPSFLLTTHGDVVVRNDDRGALLELLRPIDDPDEAALIALFDGYRTGCPTTAIGDSTMLRGTETLVTADGFEVRSEWDGCADGLFRQSVRVSEGGTVTELEKTLLGKPLCASGRRPAGLCTAPRALRGDGVSAFLARMAELEAASVYAFERLARELTRFRAPAELIAAAPRAARDEIRHALVIGTLARTRGGDPRAPIVADLPERSPEAVALENAVEGCVRETYGALLAHHQALAARDPEIAAVMRAIAKDETRHAQLSWAIAQWLEPQLSAQARAALALARRTALAQLQREAELTMPAAEARTLGLPSPEIARATLAQLGRTLQIS